MIIQSKPLRKTLEISAENYEYDSCKIMIQHDFWPLYIRARQVLQHRPVCLALLLVFPKPTDNSQL